MYIKGLTVLVLSLITLCLISGVNAPIQTNITPNNITVKDYFYKIANVPYKANYDSNQPKTPQQFWHDNYGDCDDKAVAFLDYLYGKGERNLALVVLSHESGEYSHATAMWNNRIYDPTITPPIYNMEPERYYTKLESLGFKSRYTTPYKP